MEPIQDIVEYPPTQDDVVIHEEQLKILKNKGYKNQNTFVEIH